MIPIATANRKIETTIDIGARFFMRLFFLNLTAELTVTQKIVTNQPLNVTNFKQTIQFIFLLLNWCPLIDYRQLITST